MNRVWLIGGVLVLALTGLFAWFNTAKDAQLDVALILADATTPGCDGPGQLHLTLGNAATRPISRVEGVLSIAPADTDQPIPIGNFTLTGPFTPGQKSDACVAVDETQLAGRDRTTLQWLARATTVEFGG